MNFDNVIDRKGTYCTQWDYIEDRFGEGTKDLTPFTISDMDFCSPKEIIEKIISRAKHGVFGYSRWNHGDYKGAIKNWFFKRCDTIIKEEWISYSPSVLYSITLLLEKILESNGKVMTHTPKYDGFTKLLKPYDLFEIQLKEDESGRFYTDFLKIEEGFKQGVKVFLLCSPQNPTGKVWSVEELTTLIKLCTKYDVYLISDEIHMDVVRKTHTPVLSLDISRSIIVSSPSKTFNTPTLGGSYAIIPQKDIREKFIDHIKNIDGVSTAAIFSVLSTITAYNQCEYWVDELNKYIGGNLELVKRELDGYMGLKVNIPEATYLMWIDFKETGLKTDEFQERLIRVGKVAIMSGDIYGDPYKIRFNVGCSRVKLKKGINGIKLALNK